MSIYSRFFYAKYFDCRVSLTSKENVNHRSDSHVKHTHDARRPESGADDGNFVANPNKEGKEVSVHFSHIRRDSRLRRADEGKISADSLQMAVLNSIYMKSGHFFANPSSEKCKPEVLSVREHPNSTYLVTNSRHMCAMASGDDWLRVMICTH